MSRSPLELRFTLDFRPRALKNSRTSRGKYTVVNPKAAERLRQAKGVLSEQFYSQVPKGTLPLDKCFDLTVTCYYANYRSWLDSDALVTWAMDALKGVVVMDDKPAFIRDVTGKPRFSRQAKEHIEITLTEVL